MNKLLIFKLILLVFFGSFFLYGCGKNEPIMVPVYETETELMTEEESIVHEIQEEKSIFYVYICGAIEKPGVYEIEEDTRLYQLIALAGGFLEDAATDSVNQARKMADGEQIKIPTTEEISSGQVIEEATNQSATNQAETKISESLININSASEAELCTIIGVGLTRAQSIIVYREANGNFQEIEDIMKVDGIKEGLFDKMKDQIKAN